ncbi:MAG: hypothetical protein QXO21_01590 [Candidatus Anstonellales archaeon]
MPKGNDSKLKCKRCNSKEVLEVSKTLFLCKAHFEEYLYKKFKRSIRDFKILKPGIKVGFTIDDSISNIVLVHFMVKLSEEFPYKITCAKLTKPLKSMVIRNSNKQILKKIAISKPEIIFLPKTADDIAIYLTKFLFEKSKTIPKLSKLINYKRNNTIYCCPLWQITENELILYAKHFFSDLNLEEFKTKKKNRKIYDDKNYAKAMELIRLTKTGIVNVESKIINFFKELEE